jgi:hypothetical protein
VDRFKLAHEAQSFDLIDNVTKHSFSDARTPDSR